MVVTAQTVARAVTRPAARPTIRVGNHPLWKLLPPGALVLAFALAARALWWHCLAVALAVVSLGQSVGMLVGGDRLYAGQGYALLREVPGGMRTYGVALLALGVLTAAGYGQARAGAGRLLRRCLAGVAGWYIGWLCALLGTWAIRLEIPAWNALWLNAFVAFTAVLVAAAVPPDQARK
jgi:hypothetical protein